MLNPTTIVGVVYSPNQRRKRRVIVSDHGDAHVMAHKNNMLPGEAWMTIPMETYKTFTHPDHEDEHLAKHLGGPALSHVCAVVDHKDNIVAVVAADPRIDDHPEGHLIQDDESIRGHKYDLVKGKVIKPE